MLASGQPCTDGTCEFAELGGNYWHHVPFGWRTKTNRKGVLNRWYDKCRVPDDATTDHYEFGIKDLDQVGESKRDVLSKSLEHRKCFGVTFASRSCHVFTANRLGVTPSKFNNARKLVGQCCFAS
jgi:hypothetical protein